MTRPAPRASRWWPGARSILMATLAVLWIAVGSGVAQGLGKPLENAPHALLPAHTRSIIWASTGALALAAVAWCYACLVVPACARHAARAHALKDGALGALAVMPAIRTASYVVAWFASTRPGGMAGEPNGYYYAALHGGLVLAVIATALIPPRLPASMAATPGRPHE